MVKVHEDWFQFKYIHYSIRYSFFSKSSDPPWKDCQIAGSSSPSPDDGVYWISQDKFFYFWKNNGWSLLNQCHLTEEKKALKGKRQNRYSLVTLQMFCSGGRRMELAALARVVGTSAPGQKICPVLYFPVKRKLLQSNANRPGISQGLGLL